MIGKGRAPFGNAGYGLNCEFSRRREEMGRLADQGNQGNPVFGPYGVAPASGPMHTIDALNDELRGRNPGAFTVCRPTSLSTKREAPSGVTGPAQKHAEPLTPGGPQGSPATCSIRVFGRYRRRISANGSGRPAAPRWQKPTPCPRPRPRATFPINI